MFGLKKEILLGGSAFLMALMVIVSLWTLKELEKDDFGMKNVFQKLKTTVINPSNLEVCQTGKSDCPNIDTEKVTLSKAGNYKISGKIVRGGSHENCNNGRTDCQDNESFYLYINGKKIDGCFGDCQDNNCNVGQTTTSIDFGKADFVAGENIIKMEHINTGKNGNLCPDSVSISELTIYDEAVTPAATINSYKFTSSDGGAMVGSGNFQSVNLVVGQSAGVSWDTSGATSTSFVCVDLYGGKKQIGDKITGLPADANFDNYFSYDFSNYLTFSGNQAGLQCTLTAINSSLQETNKINTLYFTKANPTMSFVSFSPNSISAGQTSYLKWSATGADKTKVTCKDNGTVVAGIDNLDMTINNEALNYPNGYPFNYNDLISVFKGPITCEFTPYSGSTAGTSMSATLILAAVPTPTCSISFYDPTNTYPITELTVPSSTYMRWSSTNATSVKGYCTGVIPVYSASQPEEIGLSNKAYQTAVFSQTGTETCYCIPYNGSTKGTTQSATLTLSAPKTYSCTGSDPSNAILCSGDDTGLTVDVPKSLVPACTSYTKCEYTCKSGFTYNSTTKTCVAVINGTCGTASKTYPSSSISYGTDTFCTTGTASPANPAFPSTGSSVTWSCVGSNGGTTASCKATRSSEIINGTCGSANGTMVSSAPTSNLCLTGNPSSVSGSGPWTWTCNGINGGTSASCSANKSETTPTYTYSSSPVVVTMPSYTYSYTAKVAPASGPATNVALLLSVSALVTLGVWVVMKKIKG